MFASFSEFLSHLGKMVTFEGDNPGDASIGTLLTVIALAEDRINRDAKTGYNETAFAGTVASNSYTLPANFRSASVVHFGRGVLTPLSIDELTDYNAASGSAVPGYFATVGRTLTFAPSVADGTTVQGYYFKAFDALNETSFASNTLIAAAPSLYIAACMVEAAPLYGFMDLLPMYEQKYQFLRDKLNNDRHMQAYSAGRIKVRSSTRLIG